MATTNLKKFVADIPNFPKHGILFRDISTLLANARIFRQLINKICRRYQNNLPDKIIGLDARGFIFAAAVAYQIKAGLLMARKPKKLPGKTIKQAYALEYGKNSFELQANSIKRGEKILIIDDLLATGGSTEAVCKLIEKMAGIVIGIEFIIELAFLKGRKRLQKYPIHAQIIYEQ